MVTQIVSRERAIEIGPGPYFERMVKDEIKAHMTPSGNKCTIRRGVVIKVEPYAYYDQRATIMCECGTVVTQSS